MKTTREIALEKENAALRKELKVLKMQLDSLQNQFNAVLIMFQGKKSEKRTIDLNQLGLFPQETVEQTLENKKDDPAPQEAFTQVKKKGKPVRSKLPEELRREIIEIYPDYIPQGSKLIGKEITETLEIIPAEVYVKQYVRFKYALPQQEGVVIGTMPLLPIYKSNAGSSILAHIFICKFIDHLPYYRQIAQFKRLGISLSDSTINGWFKGTCNLMEPLYELMIQKVIRSGYLMVDESTIPVQNSNKKGATHTGYHWVYYAPDDKVVIFDYQAGRGAQYPKEFLKNFTGHIQTDGYGVYDYFDRTPRITVLACMAHARRKFWEAQGNDHKRANEALNLIGTLYGVEKQARDKNMSYEQRCELRKTFAKPAMDELKIWLDLNKDNVLPKSNIGKAIKYTLNLWHRFERYLMDGKFEIDNNLIENSIRPMALGRKNYLFAGNDGAAQNAAMMYSFLGTCKKNDVNPNQWLPYAIENLPYCKTQEEYEKLLPENSKW